MFCDLKQMKLNSYKSNNVNIVQKYQLVILAKMILLYKSLDLYNFIFSCTVIVQCSVLVHILNLFSKRNVQHSNY